MGPPAMGKLYTGLVWRASGPPARESPEYCRRLSPPRVQGVSSAVATLRTPGPLEPPRIALGRRRTDRAGPVPRRAPGSGR
eukprot:COSAG02_NODE_20109_length_848_cov_0.946595_1_plen_81_part_00